MKIFDPKRHLPLGWEWEQTQDRLIWGHLLSGLSILGFLVRYSYALDALYFYQEGPGGTLIRELDPNRTIAPFRELISGAPLLQDDPVIPGILFGAVDHILRRAQKLRYRRDHLG